MIFDAFVLLAILISAIVAFLRGFIREVLTIIGVAGGVIAAFVGGPFLLPLMNGWLGVPSDPDKMTRFFGFIPKNIVADIAAYGVIFVAVVVVLSVLSYFLSSGAKAMGLGPVDRALGVLFGLVRAVLLLSLLYLPVYMMTSAKERDHWAVFKDSKTRFFLEQGAGIIAGFIPENAEKTASEKGEKAGAGLKALQDGLKAADAVNKAATPAAPATGDGYKNNQRQNLDTLIRQNQ